ncbi:MAG: PD-(D/E)XK nuclease family protein [Candidatus Paracaedibacteraceae bacterium]|nr:PD-(D/E)XK nuclease family protein [Candidatus Paracaedibacteraceae bacterium]
MGQIFTIPFGHCFLKTVSQFIRNKHQSSVFDLASMHVWLPTNRSIIGLKESLLTHQVKNEQSFVLPQLHSLTDLESKNPLALKEIYDLPKAIGSFERMALVMDFLPASMHVKNAYAIAEYLISLHDECIIADVSVELLESQYDEKLFENAPAHVQDAFQNLRILTYHLPNALSKRGLVPESWRRQQAMRILAADLANNGSVDTILVGGTTGTIPATRALLKAVRDLPNGIVVLPGLGNEFDEKRVLEMLSHPQHTLFSLCQFLKVKPSEVPSLLDSDSFLAKVRAQDIVSMFDVPPFEVIDHKSNRPILIECADQAEEARAITHVVRKKLFETDHSIAIVTPNQGLMRRLKAEFSLHGITPNISSGVALIETPVGSFFVNFVSFLKDPSSSTFIHLAKHPLCAKKSRSDHLLFVRRYEIELRKMQKKWNANEENLFVLSLNNLLVQRNECQSFYDFIRFIKCAVEEISNGTVFNNNDGESAASFFDALIKMPPFIRKDFEDALLTLMDMAPAVHTPIGIGSRVRILGTLEARLNTSDVVICASLNEGNWPKTPENDLILSESFRLSVGLPSQKRRQGLAAHDFCTSFYAPCLYMTRSIREGGEVALQSRLWTRLLGRYERIDTNIIKFSNYKISSQAVIQNPPAPTPLKDRRPTIYYASHVEQLMRDPYAYYTRHLLKIDSLPVLNEAVSTKEKGQVFHNVLDKYLKDEREPTFEKLVSYSKPFFDTLEKRGGGIVKTFWWYRFKRIAAWWHEKLDSEAALLRSTEVTGETVLLCDGKYVSLKSRADRIDVLAERQELRIIDYKTGILPTRRSVQNGASPQLLVEAVIAHNQGFGVIFPIVGSFQLEYWRLTGGEPAGECLTFSLLPADRVKIQQSLTNVLSHYLNTKNAYLATGSFSESRFFSRMEEWEIVLSSHQFA